jgi:hypothetical protein
MARHDAIDLAEATPASSACRVASRRSPALGARRREPFWVVVLTRAYFRLQILDVVGIGIATDWMSQPICFGGTQYGVE